jgi:ATP-dependent helicase/nuclease subunit A
VLAIPSEDKAWHYGDVHALSFPIDTMRTDDEITREHLPEWAHKKCKKDQEKQRIHNPSAFLDSDEMHDAPLANGTASSYQRGRMLHRLLQLLPELPEEKREEAALRFLHHQGGQNVGEIESDVKEVLAVLHHPVFAPIFSKSAQAEVPIIGRVKGKMFSGQMDRLLVTDTEVLVVDFKTNRPPPQNLAGVVDAYLAQMACYALLLEKIYPDRTIRTALLWTHSLILMPLDDAAMQRGIGILSGA